jgi:hypothetical protein
MTLKNNVATPITTIVGVGGKSPPNVGDKSSKPLRKGQPNKADH